MNAPLRFVAGSASEKPLMRCARWVWRNVLPGVTISLVLIVVASAAAEIYLRASAPDFRPSVETIFDPRVGGLFRPGSEAALTNNLDYWTRQRVNSLGFLDREPLDPISRRGKCHVVFIGDSFVEAQQVPIDEKVQVLLERAASDRAHKLAITAAAFGMSDTGQINQLAFYDHFARLQAPKVVILVFVKNDFADNSALLQAATRGRHPQHMPRLFARRDSTGGFSLQPPDPDWERHALSLPPSMSREHNGLRAWVLANSHVYRWIEEHAWRAALLAGRWWYGKSGAAVGSSAVSHYAKLLGRDPAFAALLQGWDPESKPAIDEVFFEEHLPRAFREALELTGFALDQFLERARRDNFKLVILATQTLKRDDGNSLAFDRMADLARTRQIPVIDLHSSILAKGGRVSDARFRYDGHWSPQGHKWAAQAVLDHLEQNPGYCAGN